MTDFFLTNLELRASDERGEMAEGLSHSTMKGMVLLTVLELAANGEPRGAVTVLHDAGDTGDRYQELARALASDGWAIALPDLRGHGRTEGPRGHSAGLREVERDVQEILDHLAYRMPDAPKVLVGIGLGALYAAMFADRNPDSLAALALVNPLRSLPFTEPAAPKGLGRFFKKVTGESEGSTGYSAEALTADAGEASRWTSSELTHQSITLRSIEEARRAEAEHLAAAVRGPVPTLLIRGLADPLAPPAGSDDLAAAATACVDLESARHHPFQDTGRAEAIEALRSWLDGLLPRA